MTVDECKAKGNAAFSAGRFEEAVTHFSDAIKIDDTNHVLFSNRSAAYASLKNFEAALEDATKTVEIKPEWPKGYSRLGAAHYGLGDHDASMGAYNKGLEIDPSNDTLKSGLEEVESAKTRLDGRGADNPIGNLFSSPDVWAKISTNPMTRGFLAQPDFVQMLSAVQANPSMLSNYMNDPRMMQVMGVLLGVNMQSGEDFMKGDQTADSAPTAKAPVPQVSDEEKEEKAQKAAAQAEKELGNAAYKAKSFEEAVAHYSKAIELDSMDISFLTNRAAVYIEMGENTKCIEDCDLAIEKGRETRADYKMMARAMTRKGTALEKSGDPEGAISWYNRALTEHRNPDTLTKLRKVEAAFKKATEDAYLNPELAESEKNKGNDAFKAQQYPDAVKFYSEALKRNPNDHKIYSNRAACYMKLGAFMEAQKDADRCIEIDPKFPKGYTRKGGVQFFMKEYDKAMETYQKGLEIDPENEELKNGIKSCIDKINQGNRGELSEDEMKARQEKAMADPEIQNILQDPVMRQVLQDMQADPKAAQEHMKNTMVMAKIQKLVNAGILQIR